MAGILLSKDWFGEWELNEVTSLIDYLTVKAHRCYNDHTL